MLFGTASLSESTKYSSENVCTFFLSKFLYIPLNFMFLDVVEALPSDLQKQADSSDPFIPVRPLPISCLLVSMSSDIFW